MQFFILLILFFTYTTLVAAMYTKTIINNIILSSLFSVLNVIFYITLRAPDVAITEAAIGSALTTLIFLFSVIHLSDEIPNKEHKISNSYFLYSVLFLSLMCIYLSLNLPEFGNIKSQVHFEIGKYYTERTMLDFGFSNIVTAILGGYRGFDTMFETCVIMMAAFGVKKILKDK